MSAPPTIFLSHSGHQKDFVEDLYNELRNANHTESSVFFDKHSLPKGCPFPDYIRKAALGCSLGVVILSDEFMTSKWPMLELEMFFQRKNPNVNILPVCYKLNFDDLKLSSNISKWKEEWAKIDDGNHVDHWEKAVHALAHCNGEVFTPKTSKTAYIKKVVHHICNLVPCPVPHDMSDIQGHQRLAKEIATMFDDVKASFSEESTCMLGLYGVAGLGKTTLSKSMVNYYTAQYLGRSHLIEFPSDGDKSKIVKACKKALRQLMNFDKELVLDKVITFDQVIGLMKEHVKSHDMFLAIDNVSKSCKDEAKKLVRVGFSATSKVLVTSRNEEILMEVLMQHNVSTKYPVKRLPTLKHEEAFQIFQETLDLGNLCPLLDRGQIDISVERCRFGSQYHPLALKGLAHCAKKDCVYEDLENWKRNHLPFVLEEIRHTPGLQTPYGVVKLSYNNLHQMKKHIFQDIILFGLPHVIAKDSFMLLQVNAKHPFKISLALKWIYLWLEVFYVNVSETQQRSFIDDLALDGFLRIEASKDGTEKRVTVHDLYLNLAHQEAENSSRLIVTLGSIRSWEKVEWGRLERVKVWGSDGTRFLEKVRNNKCKKLQLMSAGNATIDMGKMNLDCMPHLRVLVLDRVTSRRWAAAPGRVIKLNALVQLVVLTVDSCDVERITGLDVLPNLRQLIIKKCPRVKKLEGLSGLIRLKQLHVGQCKSLKTMISGLTHVESPLVDVESPLVEAERFLSPTLKFVRVEQCRLLEKMPDLDRLTCLESLVLFANGALEVEVGGMYLSSTLKKLKIEGCKGTRRFRPSLKKCVHLKELRASQGVIKDSLLFMKPLSLKTLTITNSDLSYGDRFNEQWIHATLLQHLTIGRCNSIEKLEVGCLMSSLKILRVYECEALKEIGDLGALQCSRAELHISDCPRLKKVGGLGGILARLKSLELIDCESLEEIGIEDVKLILESVKEVTIVTCPLLDPDLTFLMRPPPFLEQRLRRRLFLTVFSLLGLTFYAVLLTLFI